MAKNDKAPEWQKAGTGDIAGGNEAMAFALRLMNSGLPQELKDSLTKQFLSNQGGMLRSGEQDLKENLASNGKTPIGTLVGGLVSNQSNANKNSKDFFTNLMTQDFGAKQQGFNNLSQVQGLLAGLSGQMNDYKLNAYNINKMNEFNWGQLIGDAMGFTSKFIKPSIPQIG